MQYQLVCECVLTPALNAFQVSWMKAVDLGHKIRRLICVILVLTVLSDST